MKTPSDVPRTDRRTGVGDRRTGRDRRALPRLSVIPIADGLGEWWTELADVGVTIDILQPDVDVQPPPDTVAIILAAGSVEHVAEWFRDHRLPRGMPVIVVGADRARRQALDIVAAGATNYFALPDDAARAARYPRHHADGWRASADQVDVDDPFGAIRGREPGTATHPRAGDHPLGARERRRADCGRDRYGQDAPGPGAPQRWSAAQRTVHHDQLLRASPAHLIESELFGKEREC